MNPSQTVIMSLEEPRPRGTVLGERTDRRRVPEAEHYFRCKACNGGIDARDLVWIKDHEGLLPHPAQDQAQQRGRPVCAFVWCSRCPMGTPTIARTGAAL